MHRARALAVVLLVAAPGGAGAAIAFAPCPGDRDGIECGRVTCRSTARAPCPARSTSRSTARRRATQPARGVLLGLPGGPGDSALGVLPPPAARLRRDPRDARPRLRRPARDRAPRARCVRRRRVVRRGARRRRAALYTSRDVADDVEAVRAALGVERLALYGISYGTWFAQTYARRHPARVEALVLDAPVSLSAQDDAFRLATYFGALPRGDARDLRRRRVPRRSPRTRTATSASSLGARAPAAEGPARRRRRPARAPSDVDAASAALSLSNLDVNPPLRAELPAAVAAARARRRRAAAAAGRRRGLQPPDDATAFFSARREHRHAVRGDRAAVAAHGAVRGAHGRGAPADRPARRARVRADRPRASRCSASLAPLCERWPARAADPLERGPLPAVPTLVLVRRRRPAHAVGRRGARSRARSRGARLMLVREHRPRRARRGAVGLRVARGRGAARTAARQPAACPRAGLLPRPAFPRRLDDVPGARAGARGAAPSSPRPCMTATDALNQAAMRFDAQRGRSATVRFGGLRGGRCAARSATCALRGAVYVPGVAVSGTATAVGAARPARGRRGCAGSLRVRGRRVTGTLGGERVRADALAARRSARRGVARRASALGGQAGEAAAGGVAVGQDERVGQVARPPCSRRRRFMPAARANDVRTARSKSPRGKAIAAGCCVSPSSHTWRTSSQR